MGTSTNPKFVIDSSVIISYLMVDERIKLEHQRIIDQHLHHMASLHAPLLLPFEVGNSLKSAVLSKRITPAQATELFSQLQLLEISLAPMTYPPILALSISCNLSFYDASYVALSKKLRCPLLTLDKKLLGLTR